MRKRQSSSSTNWSNAVVHTLGSIEPNGCDIDRYFACLWVTSRNFLNLEDLRATYLMKPHCF